MRIAASLLFVALLLPLTGCGDDPSGPDTDSCYTQCRWVGDHFDCVDICP